MQPWLAVVAITMMPINRRTMKARWARNLGKRILELNSGCVLRFEDGWPRSNRVGSISQLALDSTVPNRVRKSDLSLVVEIV